eukprot:m.271909 g.271909  ORF g.271909 m.271909 type:complete len:997 (+) comp40555_c0_seq40:76-3066(+)
MAAASLNLWASRVDTKLTYLKKNIRVSDDLLDALMAEELITYDDREEICVQPTNARKLTKLIDVIRFKGPDSFERFCNGLKTAGKHLVMEELTREEGESQGNTDVCSQAGRTEERSKRRPFDEGVIQRSTSFACLTGVAVDLPAYKYFMEVLGRPKGDQLTTSYIQKLFGARSSPPIDGFSCAWEGAGKLPLSSSVAAAFTSAPGAPIIVPVNVESVLGPASDESASFGHSQRGSLDLYNILKPFRAAIPDVHCAIAKPLPLAVCIAFHDSDLTEVRQSTFRRKVKDALPEKWPHEVKFIQRQKERLQKKTEQLLTGLSCWTPDDSAENLALGRKILLEFLDHPVLSESVCSLGSLGDFIERNFITPTQPYSFIDLRPINEVLCSLSESGPVMEEFNKCGLVSAAAAENALCEKGGCKEWLSIFTHYGIFIPTHMKPLCGTFIVPYLLQERKLPDDPQGYSRGRKFDVLRKKYSIAQELFYGLTAMLVSYYPDQPACYHGVAWLNVDKSGYILELKLEEHAIVASLLVPTSNKSLTSSEKAEHFHKEMLRKFVKRLNQGYLEELPVLVARCGQLKARCSSASEERGRDRHGVNQCAIVSSKSTPEPSKSSATSKKSAAKSESTTDKSSEVTVPQMSPTSSSFTEIEQAEGFSENRQVCGVADRENTNEKVVEDNGIKRDDKKKLTMLQLKSLQDEVDDCPVLTFSTVEASIRENRQILGSGSFGTVFLARLQLHDEERLVAVKKFNPPGDRWRSSVRRLHRRQFSSEIRALTRTCHHHNIVKILTYCCDGPELFLVYELITGGTLREALSKENKLPLSATDRLHISQDASSALEYIHDICCLVHRDIKTSNMLLTDDKTIKVGDFGLSEVISSDDGSFAASSAAGTRSYMAPEALKGRVSQAGDVYAFGMVLYELVTGLPPYIHSKKTDLICYMRDLEMEREELTVMLDPRAQWLEEVARELFEIAKQCSNFRQQQRPKMKEVSEEIERILARFHP